MPPCPQRNLILLSSCRKQSMAGHLPPGVIWPAAYGHVPIEWVKPHWAAPPYRHLWDPRQEVQLRGQTPRYLKTSHKQPQPLHTLARQPRTMLGMEGIQGFEREGARSGQQSSASRGGRCCRSELSWTSGSSKEGSQKLLTSARRSSRAAKDGHRWLRQTYSVARWVPSARRPSQLGAAVYYRFGVVLKNVASASPSS